MSCCLNVSSDDCEVSVVGRRFHTCAAATGKAQSPRVRRRVIGTSSAVDDPERSHRRESTSAARLKSLSKVSRSEAEHTPEYQCSQFEHDPIRNRQLVQFTSTRCFAPVLSIIVLTVDDLLSQSEYVFCGWHNSTILHLYLVCMHYLTKYKQSACQ